MAEVQVAMSPERVMRLAHSLHDEMARRLRAESTSALTLDLTFVESKFRLRPVGDGVEMDYAVPIEFDSETKAWRYEAVRVTVRSIPFV